MSKVIRLTESDLNRIVKRILNEEDPKPSPSPGKYISNVGGTNTESSGAYVTPGGIRWNTKEYGGRITTTGGYDDPYYPDDPYDTYDPKYPRNPDYKKTGSYEKQLGRSPMCCKKCKNGRFKHQCDDSQASGKYDSTNCVYATISDCQLNKRSKPGNIKGKRIKKKSKN